MKPDDMNYNTQRPYLVIPDYGRNVQLLIEYVVNDIMDKEDRTKAIEILVHQIAQQNPNMKNQPEYLQKIWGHLYIISDYQLDINCPYPLPERPTEKTLIGKRLEYTKQTHKYRFYGKNVELMIEKAIQMEDDQIKENYINTIANYMRLAYRIWNDDRVSDEIILGHILDLSEGKIKLEKMPEAPKIESTYQNRESRRPRMRNNNRRYYKK